MQNELTHINETSLMDSFRKNDLKAFHVLYDICFPQICHYAMRIVKDQEQAEDIISESFLILWQKRVEFDTLKSVTAYLYSVTRNACISHLRKKKVKMSRHQELAYLQPSDDQPGMLDSIREDLIQYSLIAAQRLPAEMKKVFHLIYVDGFSAVEAAEKLQLSVKTIHAQRLTAVKRVRDVLIKKGLLNLFL